MKLDFSEIKNWKEFEDLAAAYFRSMPEIGANSVKEVFVQPSGEGSDGEILKRYFPKYYKLENF